MEAARRKLGLPLIIAERDQTILRELTPGDYPAVCRLVTEEQPGSAVRRLVSEERSEVTVCQPLPEPCGNIPLSEEKLADPVYYTAYVKNQYPLFGYGLWGLFRKNDRKLLGIAGFDAPPDDSADLELGYHIGEDFRRQGYAIDACLAALSYAEKELGAERILIRVRRDNIPSLRLSEKLKASLLQMKGRFRIHITVL